MDQRRVLMFGVLCVTAAPLSLAVLISIALGSPVGFLLILLPATLAPMGWSLFFLPIIGLVLDIRYRKDRLEKREYWLLPFGTLVGIGLMIVCSVVLLFLGFGADIRLH